MKDIIERTLICFLLVFSTAVLADPLMYVPTGDRNELLVIDLKTNKIIKSIGELENSHGLAAVPFQEYLVAGSMATEKTKGEKNQ